MGTSTGTLSSNNHGAAWTRLHAPSRLNISSYYKRPLLQQSTWRMGTTTGTLSSQKQSHAYTLLQAPSRQPISVASGHYSRRPLIESTKSRRNTTTDTSNNSGDARTLLLQTHKLLITDEHYNANIKTTECRIDATRANTLNQAAAGTQQNESLNTMVAHGSYCNTLQGLILVRYCLWVEDLIHDSLVDRSATLSGPTHSICYYLDPIHLGVLIRFMTKHTWWQPITHRTTTSRSYYPGPAECAKRLNK